MYVLHLIVTHTVVQKHAIVSWSLHSHWWYHWKPFSHTHTHTHCCCVHHTSHHTIVSSLNIHLSQCILYSNHAVLSRIHTSSISITSSSHISQPECAAAVHCAVSALLRRGTPHTEDDRGMTRTAHDHSDERAWANNEWMMWCINRLVRARMIRWVEG